jgi:hypothetical protein
MKRSEDRLLAMHLIAPLDYDSTSYIVDTPTEESLQFCAGYELQRQVREGWH